MKFRYLGKKENMTAFGYDFSNDATPDVTDENAIKKLSGNSHFEAIKETAPPSVQEMLDRVSKAATEVALIDLADGENRKPVLDAIAKKKAELTGKS